MSDPRGRTSDEPLRTERLILRRWSDTDRQPFAALNADPVVMEHFPAVLTGAESDSFIDRIEENFQERGWGLWAVQPLDTPGCIGYVGLWPAVFEAHFTPAVEVGWRLAAAYWNHGYATEGAQAVTAFGFDVLSLDEIVSFTSVLNVRSTRVMQKLGMTHDPGDDFDHPFVAEGHRLRRHVLYRLTNPHPSIVRNTR
jgi:RimJ/RimL family protein N-acetyltransferase